MKARQNQKKNSSSGQNTNYFDLVYVRDYKSYQNAKISGALGIGASAVGTVVSLGASIATGNIAGVVGALSGGTQGIVSGVQKLQGLEPIKQSPAANDFTTTNILNDVNSVIIEMTGIPEESRESMVRYLEENGAAVAIPFSEYMSQCQMSSYNAVKMAYMEITGIPAQAARRIADSFIGGVTLWTSTDVGNKKVINYPVGVA